MRPATADASAHTVGRQIVLIVDVALLIAGLGVSTTRITLGFYVVIAQVLPVLLLAVVVQGRYFRDLDRRGSFDGFVLKGLLYLPLLGEAAALSCIAHGGDSAPLRGMVLLAVGITAGLVIHYACDGPTTELRTSRAAQNESGVNHFGSSANQVTHTAPDEFRPAEPAWGARRSQRR
ncbi:MAG: hypothetical protein JWN10_2309 [Solirubrobacterales bacterium]|nr:hypothetical protein [Solirubrobacterales bacterium]